MATPPLQPGQQPTSAQIAEFQRQFQAEAARQGLTPQQFGAKLRAQQAAQQQPQNGKGGASQAQQQQQSTQHQHQHQRNASDVQTAVGQGGAPKPEALAVASFLKAQPLKSRTVVLQEKRKDMFKVKRALRALQSDTYQKARTKNSVLPEVNDRASAENAFKLLPLSMLAIRVGRDSDRSNPPHGAPGHVHGADDDEDDDDDENEDGATKKKKRQKTKRGKDGKPLPWNVHILQHQETADQHYYVWFHETVREIWYRRLVAVGVLAAVVAVVLFPLWPLMLRQGVWYLSIACLGVLGAFFGLALVRLALFVVTVSVGPKPGIWIYPNLFEDVGFFDSFRPGWEWRETKESAVEKKKEKKAKKLAKKNRKLGITSPAEGDGEEKGKAGDVVKQKAVNGTTGANVNWGGNGEIRRRDMKAKVEEVEDE